MCWSSPFSTEDLIGLRDARSPSQPHPASLASVVGEGSGTGSKWLTGRPDHVPSMRCCPSEDKASIDADIPAARERVRHSSLAYTDQTEPSERSEVCPRTSGRVILELYTGTTVPDRCRSSQCPFCLPLNARRRALAITYAGPRRMIRLSVLASESDTSPCTTALTRVGLIRRNLKRMGLEPGEWSFTMEPNPKGTGYHAHCLQHGPSIPQAELQESCARSGAGIPYINSIRREGVWTSRYGLKGFGADGYGLKAFRPNGSPREALRINNGRLEHHSRGFFAIDGDTLRVRDMEREALAALNEAQRTAYVGTTQDMANRVLADQQLRHAMIADMHQRSTSLLRAVR